MVPAAPAMLMVQPPPDTQFPIYAKREREPHLSSNTSTNESKKESNNLPVLLGLVENMLESPLPSLLTL